MIVRELLARKGSTAIIGVPPTARLIEVARILRHHNIGALLVMDEIAGMVGVVSERDLVKALVVHGADLVDRPVAEVMTRSVVTCAPSDAIVETLELMNEKRIRHIPVIEHGRPCAMLSIREFDHAYRRLQAESRTDELTGLANRRAFLATLDREMSRHARFATPLALAVIDIDHFKSVNDSFGHAAGDQVLRTLAGVMGRDLRSFDEVGRIGGEEFAIVFPNSGAGAALVACERLLAAIRDCRIQTEAGLLSVTASIGISDTSAGPAEGYSLLKAADRLLYVAKQTGRNRIVVDPAVCSDADCRDLPAGRCIPLSAA